MKAFEWKTNLWSRNTFISVFILTSHHFYMDWFTSTINRNKNRGIQRSMIRIIRVSKVYNLWIFARVVNAWNKFLLIHKINIKKFLTLKAYHLMKYYRQQFISKRLNASMKSANEISYNYQRLIIWLFTINNDTIYNNLIFKVSI